MSFSVEIEGEKVLGEFVESIKKGLVTEDLLKGLAEEARSGVLERTAKGEDSGGRAFKPYSRGYKKFRSRRAKGSTRVDLNLTGRMLSAIETAVDMVKKEAWVYFRNGTKEARKARYHNAAGAGRGQVRREFFGLGVREKEKLTRLVEERIRKILNEG